VSTPVLSNPSIFNFIHCLTRHRAHNKNRLSHSLSCAPQPRLFICSVCAHSSFQTHRSSTSSTVSLDIARTTRTDCLTRCRAHHNLVHSHAACELTRPLKDCIFQLLYHAQQQSFTHLMSCTPQNSLSRSISCAPQPRTFIFTSHRPLPTSHFHTARR
jgi:hypothetical protein